MEEEIYTKDEKELFVLLKFFKNYNSNYIPVNEDEKKMVENNIRDYQKIEDDVIEVANARFENLKNYENETKKKWTTFHDVECHHCGFKTSLLPKGEEKAANGFTYFYFMCPKCNEKFDNGFPNTFKESAEYAESVYTYLDSKGPDGRINHIRLGISKGTMEDMRKKAVKLQKAVKELEKSYKKNKERYHQFAKLVADHVAFLTIEKYKFICGSKAIGES